VTVCGPWRGLAEQGMENLHRAHLGAPLAAAAFTAGSPSLTFAHLVLTFGHLHRVSCHCTRGAFSPRSVASPWCGPPSCRWVRCAFLWRRPRRQRGPHPSRLDQVLPVRALLWQGTYQLWPHKLHMCGLRPPLRQLLLPLRILSISLPYDPPPPPLQTTNCVSRSGLRQPA
jgi:hypothetical protein